MPLTSMKHRRGYNSINLANRKIATSNTEAPTEDAEKSNEIQLNDSEKIKKEKIENLDKNQAKEALKFHPFALVKASKIFGETAWQPTSETHSALMIDGVPYNKIHIVSIKASRNNTILNLSDNNGNVLYTTSAGCVGFKNSKKSTAVAGQGAGLALSENAKRRGIKNIRVIVKGFGNGRLASIKALQMGKLNIVSITDNTPIPMQFAKPPRPPAKRKV